MGTREGLEAEIVPQKGYKLHFIRIYGVRGKGLKRYLLVPFHLILSLCQSLRIIIRLKPNVVLSMGGYVSFPCALIGYLFGCPIVLHEQNSIAGLTNRLLSIIAKKICVAFPKVLPNSIHTGNPIRHEMTVTDDVERRLMDRSGPLRILVVGGSRGATALNKMLPAALGLITINRRPGVIHQSGNSRLGDLIDNYKRHGVDAECREFIIDIAKEYKAADIVICRAGAMTIAELTAFGVASILIPFPYAVDDHQTKNARFLVEAGAAILAPQADLTAVSLAKLISGLTRDQILPLAIRAKSLGMPESTQTVADICDGEFRK